jgi:hypothetical protein
VRSSAHGCAYPCIDQYADTRRISSRRCGAWPRTLVAVVGQIRSVTAKGILTTELAMPIVLGSRFKFPL